LLDQLRADAARKLHRRYLSALLTDEALVEVSAFLDWLLGYEPGLCAWPLDLLRLCRVPLYYQADEMAPGACHLHLGGVLSPVGNRLVVVALPDWSPWLRYGSRQERPQGARAGVFASPWQTRRVDERQLALRVAS